MKLMCIIYEASVSLNTNSSPWVPALNSGYDAKTKRFVSFDALGDEDDATLWIDHTMQAMAEIKADDPFLEVHYIGPVDQVGVSGGLLEMSLIRNEEPIIKRG